MPGANRVYSSLVRNSDDFVGALAYSIYKQTKVEWITAFKNTHAEIEPTASDLAIFHSAQMLPIQLQGYRDRAQALAGQFLAVALEDKLDELAQETMNSALAEKFELTHQGTVTEIVSLRSAMDSLRSEVIATKGLRGWTADIGAALLVNIITIIIVGLIALGASKSDSVNRFFENLVKASTPAPASMPTK